MFYLVQILVPVGICVVLPVLIIWLIVRGNMNSVNKRAQVLIEAIKANDNIDADKLVEALAKPKRSGRSARQLLNLRLLRGCILSLIGVVVTTLSFWIWAVEAIDTDELYLVLLISTVCLAIGIGYLIVYFVSRKQLSSDNTDSEG